MAIEVLKPGLLTTLQDRGRPGYMHLGIGRSGAFDEPALRIANALAGNPAGACGLEITLLGPTLRFPGDAVIAVTGAPIPVQVDGTDAQTWASIPIRSGATVALGAMQRGCRSYLAIRGGVATTPVLGSRSTDSNAALGPFARALRTGDVLGVGNTGIAAAPTPGNETSWRVDPRPWSDDGTHPLRLIPGDHLEILTEISHNILFTQAFNVHNDSNRVGVRLSGATLGCKSSVEMVSEGCVPGLVQLPPSGQPIAFGPECPVSGGYPRIGQIAAVDIARLAQRRPGDALRFEPCTFDVALSALRKRERALARMEAAIATRLRNRT